MSKLTGLKPLVRKVGCAGIVALPRLTRPASHQAAASSKPHLKMYTTATSPVSHAAMEAKPNLSHPNPEVGKRRLADFDLAGRTYVVTGGAQGLGIALAEGLVEAGGKVYCLDRAEEPGQYWHEAKSRVVPEWGGSLDYRQVDVTETDNLNRVIGAIAEENQGLHGLVAAAAIQQVTPALEYKPEDARKMLDVNFTGVLMSAQAAAAQMIRYNCKGSICAVASISGSVANKGLRTPVYNSSKAAVIQLCHNLAMEWAEHGIRVNSLSPGHLMTPMVQKNFEDEPHLEKMWKDQIILGRLGDPSEFKGPALFLLSNASSYVTGANLVVDGGRTAW